MTKVPLFLGIRTQDTSLGLSGKISATLTGLECLKSLASWEMKRFQSTLILKRRLIWLWCRFSTNQSLKIYRCPFLYSLKGNGKILPSNFRSSRTLLSAIAHEMTKLSTFKPLAKEKFSQLLKWVLAQKFSKALLMCGVNLKCSKSLSFSQKAPNTSKLGTYCKIRSTKFPNTSSWPFQSANSIRNLFKEVMFFSTNFWVP